jgi:hypothetical protein
MPLSQYWGSAPARKGFQTFLNEAEAKYSNRFDLRCSSPVWSDGQDIPCAGFWVKANGIMEDFTKLQASTDPTERMDIFRNLFFKNGFNPAITQAMMLLSRDDGDKYNGVAAQLKIEGGDLPEKKFVHQPLSKLEPFDRDNPDETDFIDALAHDEDLTSDYHLDY